MYPSHPRSHQKFPKSCTWEIFSLLGLAKQFFFTVLLLSKIITKQGQYHRNRSFAWCWCLVYMIFQITGLPAWVFAFLASKGFLTSVGNHVIFQSARLPAREAALITGKGFLSRMLQHVFLDIISLDAWIVVLITTEKPLPWMCCYVLFDVTPLREGRGTMGAIKWLFPWMS